MSGADDFAKLQRLIGRRDPCFRCKNTRWVCEDHQNKPWEGKWACACGAAGAPCPDCNTGDPPDMDPDFVPGTKQ
jgi:hypothetical protein